MARRRQRKKFEKGIEARRRARTAGLRPGSTRVVEDKRRKPPKHKSDWLADEN